jgi:hypothetical protein
MYRFLIIVIAVLLLVAFVNPIARESVSGCNTYYTVFIFHFFYHSLLTISRIEEILPLA